MDISHRTKVVSNIVNQIDKYNLQPAYQRSEVWSTEKKQLLIDTILRSYDMPKFWFRKVNDTNFEFEVVDGQQRITAFKKFFIGDFAVGKISDDLHNPSLVGMKFKDLPSEFGDKFLNFEINTTEIRDTEEGEIRELFLRLQEGSTLNPQEKRNAMLGNLRDFVFDLANSHIVFPRIKISNIRKQHDDLCALVTCLEIAEGPTKIDAKSLYNLYISYKDSFDVNGKVASKIKTVLNYMSKILTLDTPEMNIKWGFVDLYLLISSLIDEYYLKGHEEDFNNFYVSFEKDRNTNSDDIELINSSDPWENDMGHYLRAFKNEAAFKDKVQIRHDVYLKRLHRDIPSLKLRDTKRFFTPNERIAIWRRDGEKCTNCKAIISFKDMEADHLFAWSKGGITSLDNAQSLCKSCNASKSSS